MPQQERVEILEEQFGWYRVRWTAKNLEGWASVRYVNPIPHSLVPPAAISKSHSPEPPAAISKPHNVARLGGYAHLVIAVIVAIVWYLALSY
jgi:hypothetical protein